MNDFLTSLLRTVVPVAVGVLLTLAAKAGLDFDSGAVTEIVTVTLTGVYYAIFRKLETIASPAWGWALGYAKRPTYTDKPV